MMKDCVFIEGLQVTTTIGVYDWEKTIKQPLILDLEMEWDNRQVAISDDVTFCLNYAEVTNAIVHHIETGQFALIERVAEEIAQLIIDQFNVPKVRVKVNKPTAINIAKTVGVIIERYKL